jgi:hypothetical protein
MAPTASHDVIGQGVIRMGSQLGWVQISKAMGARGGRQSAWSDDERPARSPHRNPAVGQVLHRVFRPGLTLVLIALAAVTLVSLP